MTQFLLVHVQFVAAVSDLHMLTPRDKTLWDYLSAGSMLKAKPWTSKENKSSGNHPTKLSACLQMISQEYEANGF